MVSATVHESWLGKLVAGWDSGRKLNVFGEYYFASLNIILMGWNFGASNRILSMTLTLFLWDNALQKLNLKYLHILQSECKLLIHTLTQIGT